jgi:hypothetical protein
MNDVMYRVYNMNEKNKYTNDIIETIDTIDINDIQNLSSIIKGSYKGRDINYFNIYNKNKLKQKEYNIEEKSDNSNRSATPSSKRVMSSSKSENNYNRYINSNSNTPKSISRNSSSSKSILELTPKSINNISIKNIEIEKKIKREDNRDSEKQLLRILKNHNNVTKKSIDLRGYL